MPGRPSPSEDYRRLILSLRPTISDLFAGYAIPGDEAAMLLNASIAYLLRYGDRSANPRQFFLHMLEGECEACVKAREAEESSDDGTPCT
jgi:hypothetical protein